MVNTFSQFNEHHKQILILKTSKKKNKIVHFTLRFTVYNFFELFKNTNTINILNTMLYNIHKCRILIKLYAVS